VTKPHLRRPLRTLAALLGLAATFALASSELASHRHGLDETDLVAHAVAEPLTPHAHTPQQPLHLEAGRDAEHAACVDCLLQALSPAFTTAIAAFAVPLPRTAQAEALLERVRPAADFEAAAPRGPPSAA
jgi:hypothetical protein